MLVESTSAGALPVPGEWKQRSKETQPWQEVQQLSSGRVVGQGDVWLQAAHAQGLRATHVEVLQCGRVSHVKRNRTRAAGAAAARAGMHAGSASPSDSSAFSTDDFPTARFNVDVRAPMSIAQAFAICIANRGIADIVS